MLRELGDRVSENANANGSPKNTKRLSCMRCASASVFRDYRANVCVSCFMVKLPSDPGGGGKETFQAKMWLCWQQIEIDGTHACKSVQIANGRSGGRCQVSVRLQF